MAAQFHFKSDYTSDKSKSVCTSLCTLFTVLHPFLSFSVKYRDKCHALALILLIVII